MTLPQHYNNRSRIYFCDPLPRWGVISPTPSSLSQKCSDTHNINKNNDEKTNNQNHHEIPILKSTYTIHISYTPFTYFLTWLAIMTSLHTLFSLSSTTTTSSPPHSHTYPPIFVLFHMLFQISHLVAHLFGMLSLERFCVVYGTYLYWTGWLMGIFVFKSERLPLDLSVVAFCLLLLERRNAWGLIQWEFTSQLEDTSQNQSTAFGTSVRLIAYRIWTVFGIGLMWASVYLPLATHDGYILTSLLHPMNLIRWYFATVIGGLGMICYWSFWTFQYRGVVWQRELRKGIAVWYSDGIARAADII